MPEAFAGIGESLRARALQRRRRQRRAALTILWILAIAVFLGGITWGLPSRESDHFLFGTEPAWSGRQIMQLASPRESNMTLGADVDRDPLARTDKVVLNDTPAKRAQIVRRYRLFSDQPDEMVTLMALAEMHPGQGDFDPRLYQYGGLWVYPVGGFIRIAGALGILQLTSDLQFYLDHPEAFGRFYVVARLYVVVWGMVGAWAVFTLVRRWTRGSLPAASIACFCYIMMPVVVNMSHEAKPHLPGAVLMLLTVLAAAKYVRSSERIWWLATAVLAGSAIGMVLAAWPAWIVLVVAVVLVRQSWMARLRLLVLGLGITVVVYFATNPYVFLHLFDNRDLLRSNLNNTRVMFTPSLSTLGVVNAVRLIAEGATVTVSVSGGAAILTLIAGAMWRRNWAVRHTGWLLAVPGLLVLIQFVLFAGGQPAEYGRFAIFLDLVLLVAAVVGGFRLLSFLQWRPTPLLLLALATAFAGSRYYAGFVADTSSTKSRMLAAELIEGYRLAGAQTIGVIAEPAPYSVPPLNLHAWRIILLPKGYDYVSDRHPPDVIVRTVDAAKRPSGDVEQKYDCEFANPVTEVRRMQWAAKPFMLLRTKTNVGLTQ